MDRPKHLIVVGGATASGKTGLALRLAQHFQTEILSCDSRQFYRELNVGTAKPSRKELGEIPHHFINNLSIRERYSVGEYEREALAVLERLFENHDCAILAGGSGLYQKALCEGMDDFPEVPIDIRKELEELHQKEGIEALQEALQQADPEYYEKVDRNNPVRLIRALAVYRASGKPFSEFQKGVPAQRPFTPIYLWLQRPRTELYQRINERVDSMMQEGLPEEAQDLLPFRKLESLQTVGYQELFSFFNGDLSLEEAVAMIKQNSRRYAKRQLTWRRRDTHWTMLDPENQEETLTYLELGLKEGISFQHIPQGRPVPNDLPEKLNNLAFSTSLTLARQKGTFIGWVLQGGNKQSQWLAGPWLEKDKHIEGLAEKLWQQALRNMGSKDASGTSSKILAAFPELGKPFAPGMGFEGISQLSDPMLAWLKSCGIDPSGMAFFSK